MSAIVHDLKTLPVYFDAVERGEKTFEIRRDDRGFQKGDIVRLRKYYPGSGYELDPSKGPKPGELVYLREGEPLSFEDLRHPCFTEVSTLALTVERRVLWILTGGQFGLEPGYVILALGPVEDYAPPASALARGGV